MTEPRVFEEGDAEPEDHPELTGSGYTFRWHERPGGAFCDGSGWRRYRPGSSLEEGWDNWENYLADYGPLTEVLDEPNSFEEIVVAETEAALAPPAPGGFVTKSSGSRVDFAGGGHRDAEAGKPRFDLLRPLNVPYADQMLTRYAALMGRGAEHYGDRNWEQMGDQKALDRFRSSAARHFEQWLNGERDEDHAAAVMFNLTGAEYVRGVLAGQWEPIPEEGP